MNKQTKYQLETIFNSTYPIDCYIIKGRLETEGIDCFIYDDEIVSVDPFKSVAIGGIKLKIPSDQKEKAMLILDRLEKNLLFDENGEYNLSEALISAFEKQNIILSFYKAVIEDPDLLENTAKQKEILNPKLFSDNETNEIIINTSEYLRFNKLKFKFDWKQFFYELFDFEREFFKYLRIKPNKFYIEKDILTKFEKSPEKKEEDPVVICPLCKSKNVKYGYAIDLKLDILYLILSFLIVIPFFPFRKKNHCFECGHNFK